MSITTQILPTVVFNLHCFVVVRQDGIMSGYGIGDHLVPYGLTSIVSLTDILLLLLVYIVGSINGVLLFV